MRASAARRPLSWALFAKLAQSAQVIVVTHLPQVASWADEQYVVSKGMPEESGVVTTIKQVSGDERVHERTHAVGQRK